MTQKPPKGKLYLIPTTLGSFDTSEQVFPSYNVQIIHTLTEFVVEQVRTSRRFLSYLKHPVPIDQMVFYELNKTTLNKDISQYLTSLHEGKSIGLLSEAGTPCVADPGSKVVEMAQERGYTVVPLVGPNSLLLALMGSGFNGQNFVFHGYLPIDKSDLIKKIREMEGNILKRSQTQMFIETPFRNDSMFDMLVTGCQPATKLCVATNLTLPTESIITKTIGSWKKEKPDLHKKPTVFLLYK
ncbi:MAG: SAM-dependent methyltransferase [Bacteroidales bacterium]|nr:SAM-dependent methyltransferase [Bacteroidales bacterium]